MASMNKVGNFLLVLGKAQVNLTTDVMKVALYASTWTTTSTAYTTTSEVAGGTFGYTAGGATCTATGSTWSGTTSISYAAVAATTWTATGSGAGSTWTFRYVVYYDDTATGKPVVGWYDYGSDVTLSGPAGDKFTVTPAAGVLFTLS
jgi:hypothetical protein